VTAYDARFMEAGSAGAAANVAAVLPLVVAEIGASPESAVDVGCGAGAWVKELLDAGIDAVGIDGAWTQPHLVIPRERFVAWDLERPLGLERRFDMALSIEVAEHLSPERGPGFVSDLCSLSDVVLFSAALPGQAGTRHINLRWQSYWVRLFADNGYAVVDCVRPALWDTPSGVAWALAQQCFLFVRCGTSRLGMPIDVVHPGMHHELTYPPRLRKVIGDLPGALKRFVEHHATRARRRGYS
jgi:SAM-dependent methyltransferase